MTAQKTSKGNTASKTARLVPEPEPTKVKKVATVHFKGTTAPTACKNYNPTVSITTDEKLVTCKTCLAIMSPKTTTKKTHEKKPDVTITCADCGAKRVVPASQANTVTRCLECQKKAIKAKRKAKAKVRKTNKGAGLKNRATDLLKILTETSEDLTGEALRALATLIYKTYPKAKKV